MGNSIGNGINNNNQDSPSTSNEIFIKRGESFAFNSPSINKKNRINKVSNFRISNNFFNFIIL